ncbi:MAG: class I SAM-dependent methyltransferase, partial [Rhodospirillaceae bacterium]|nr:class I SAM-dependent methyltransferase [Rhodospirillaceae bacterium]
GRVPKFAAALAQQCFITDYAYAETPDETQAVDTMAARAEAMLQQGTLGQKLESALTAIAMYRPLNTLAGIEKAVVSTELAPLLYQQSGGPAEEAALAASVAVLSEEVSEPAVRQQYEDAPYPRWLTTDRKMPVPMAAAVGALFPKLDYTPGAATPRILVAGCGTGKQAMDAATQYKDAQVTAIDISRASLGYARRMAAADGVDNIAFMAADIMALGAWEARFDLVESSGVLHHLQDPEAGWRNLCGLLAPGGLMKVALYSTLGRRDLQAARDFVARDDGNGDGNGGGKGGGAVTPERIRQARADILALAEDDPRRRATRYSDYFSLRGCRDLLFNVREQDYSLLELASMMRRLHLDFIGFQFADINLPARLAAAHPGARLDDLALWHEFETANPEIFSGMYQFWCRPSLAN